MHKTCVSRQFCFDRSWVKKDVSTHGSKLRSENVCSHSVHVTLICSTKSFTAPARGKGWGGRKALSHTPTPLIPWFTCMPYPTRWDSEFSYKHKNNLQLVQTEVKMRPTNRKVISRLLSVADTCPWPLVSFDSRGVFSLLDLTKLFFFCVHITPAYILHI